MTFTGAVKEKKINKLEIGGTGWDHNTPHYDEREYAVKDIVGTRIRVAYKDTGEECDFDLQAKESQNRSIIAGREAKANRGTKGMTRGEKARKMTSTAAVQKLSDLIIENTTAPHYGLSPISFHQVSSEKKPNGTWPEVEWALKYFGKTEDELERADLLHDDSDKAGTRKTGQAAAARAKCTVTFKDDGLTPELVNAAAAGDVTVNLQHEGREGQATVDRMNFWFFHFDNLRKKGLL
jgi:hypothetical protein